LRWIGFETGIFTKFHFEQGSSGKNRLSFGQTTMTKPVLGHYDPRWRAAGARLVQVAGKMYDEHQRLAGLYALRPTQKRVRCRQLKSGYGWV
jgi:hypothetical protein